MPKIEKTSGGYNFLTHTVVQYFFKKKKDHYSLAYPINSKYSVLLLVSDA